MLIEEARDLTGLTFEQLAEQLDLSFDDTKRYARHPWIKGSRAPKAVDIQDLENRVAKLLKRSAHIIVVENNAKISLENVHLIADIVEGKPSDGLNLRDFDSTDFQLGYEGDWPTYRRLKYYSKSWADTQTPIYKLVQRAAHNKWPEMLKLYAWQWGILWDKGLPWLSREALRIDPSDSIETFLPILTNRAKRERSLIPFLQKTNVGRTLESVWQYAMLNGCDVSLLDLIYENTMFVAESTKKLVEFHGPGVLAYLQSDCNLSSGNPSEPGVSPTDEYIRDFLVAPIFSNNSKKNTQKIYK